MMLQQVIAGLFHSVPCLHPPSWWGGFTGTSVPHVVSDYSKRATTSLKNVRALVGSAFQREQGSQPLNQPVAFSEDALRAICSSNGSSEVVPNTLYNPSAHPFSGFVRVPIPTVCQGIAAFTLADGSFAAVPGQFDLNVSAPFPWTPFMPMTIDPSPPTHTAILYLEIPPLSSFTVIHLCLLVVVQPPHLRSHDRCTLVMPSNTRPLRCLHPL